MANIAPLLVRQYRKTHDHTCKYGYKCCTEDNRKHKSLRRSARRTEKQAWKNAL